MELSNTIKVHLLSFPSLRWYSGAQQRDQSAPTKLKNFMDFEAWILIDKEDLESCLEYLKKGVTCGNSQVDTEKQSDVNTPSNLMTLFCILFSAKNNK